MLDWTAALAALAAIAILALAGWALSVRLRNAGVVDSLWSLFFLLGAGVYAAVAGAEGPRAWLLLALVALWALRLSGYLTWRNWGEPEDRRYQAIRARNQPGFACKSLYLVFGLQAALAWIIAMPLFAALAGAAPLGALDAAGIVLWLAGFAFEAIGDAQLARFKADPASRAGVLASGLWRYTRHPNYFGEALLWWGYFAIAAAAGGAWTAFAPLLMTILLLKVSGVALLEKDIGERRPAYRAYVERTSAFIPWPPKERV
jgi:steroid 5-alpha reductase family enzyme